MYKSELLKEGVDLELRVLGEAVGYGTNCSLTILTNYRNEKKLSVEIEELIIPLTANLQRAYQPYCVDLPNKLPLIKIVKTLAGEVTNHSYLLKGVIALGDYSSL